MNIAWKNIMARKMSSAKVAISIFAMVIIMCIFTAYSIALSDETERIVMSYRSGHNFIAETSAPVASERIKKIKELKGVSDVAEITVFRNINNLRGMTFYIDEKEYKCDHSYYDEDLNFGSDYYVNKFHFGDFAFVKPDEHIVLSHHKEELTYRFPNSQPILMGKDTVSDDEIIVSEYFLKEFGLDTSIINKSLTIKIGKKTYSDLQIVGIMDKHFYQLTNTYEQYFIASEESTLYKDMSKNSKFLTKVYVEDYEMSESLLNDLIKLGLVKITPGSEYGLSSATTAKIISNILTGVMATVGVGIISALTLNIIYSMRFMITKKSNFYGIMQAYGLKSKRIFEILFCEMFILSLFAIVFAYAISYGLVFLLDFLLSSMVGIGVFFSWSNFLITFSVAVCFTLLVVLVVSLINYSIYYKRSTQKLLKNTMEN